MIFSGVGFQHQDTNSVHAGVDLHQWQAHKKSMRRRPDRI